MDYDELDQKGINDSTISRYRQSILLNDFPLIQTQ